VAFDAKFRRLLVKQAPAPDTVFVRSSIGQAATRTVPTPRGGTVPRDRKIYIEPKSLATYR